MSDRTMLIVEDEEQTLDVMGRLMGQWGWEVATASTVAGALDALSANSPPALMVLDLTLPDGDGEEVLRYVRAEGLPTLVIVTSGESDGPRLDALSAMRPDAYLLKPIDIEELDRACEGPR
jgi:DNA-binding response OmpR family regulator